LFFLAAVRVGGAFFGDDLLDDFGGVDFGIEFAGADGAEGAFSGGGDCVVGA
jgi:hypothetical protein